MLHFSSEAMPPSGPTGQASRGPLRDIRTSPKRAIPKAFPREIENTIVNAAAARFLAQQSQFSVPPGPPPHVAHAHFLQQQVTQQVNNMPQLPQVLGIPHTQQIHGMDGSSLVAADLTGTRVCRCLHVVLPRTTITSALTLTPLASHSYRAWRRRQKLRDLVLFKFRLFRHNLMCRLRQLHPCRAASHLL